MPNKPSALLNIVSFVIPLVPFFLLLLIGQSDSGHAYLFLSGLFFAVPLLLVSVFARSIAVRIRQALFAAGLSLMFGGAFACAIIQQEMYVIALEP